MLVKKVMNETGRNDRSRGQSLVTHFTVCSHGFLLKRISNQYEFSQLRIRADTFPNMARILLASGAAVAVA